MPAKIRTEFTASVPHAPGSLAKVLEVLAKGGVNVLALCGYGEGQSATIMFVPDNEGKARKALAGAGYKVDERAVVCVTGASGKGSGAKLAEKLSKAAINIQYAYATTSGGGRSTAVFAAPDPKAAAAALK